MDGFDVTIEQVEAVLASMGKPPEGEDPFWWDQQELILRNLLEALKE